MRRASLAAAVLAVALTGCAGDEKPTSAETADGTATSTAPSEAAQQSPSSEPPPAEASSDDSAAVIEIEIEGDRIEPNGKLVEVPAGEPITFRVESDRAGELHVHSSPEQVLEVKKGSSTLELTIDRPGVVDVEEHDSGVVVVQLQVG